jgi:hypothetical protein
VRPFLVPRGRRSVAKRVADSDFPVEYEWLFYAYYSDIYRDDWPCKTLVEIEFGPERQTLAINEIGRSSNANWGFRDRNATRKGVCQVRLSPAGTPILSDQYLGGWWPYGLKYLSRSLRRSQLIVNLPEAKAV